MSKIHTAMVMAAGHGTRMRHLTQNRAKAMVDLGGRPLIDHMLDRLQSAGISRAVVNVHAHADHLEAHLTSRQTGPEIIISDEREALLETGGGVVKARPLLGEDPILICNIDAIWVEFAPVLPALTAAWNPAIMSDLMLLAPRDDCLGFAGAGDFDRDKTGRVSRRAGEQAAWVYAGVQIFKPLSANGYSCERFSRTRMWEPGFGDGTIYGLPLPGYWMHVGDPEARRAAEAVLAIAEGPNL